MRADRRWSGTRLHTPSASLGFTYVAHAAFKNGDLRLYSRTKSSDGLVDSRISRMTGMLTWVCSHTPTLHTTISLDASYTTWMDAVQPSNSTEDLSGLLRIQIARL